MKTPYSRGLRHGGKAHYLVRLRIRIRGVLKYYPRLEKITLFIWRARRSAMILVRQKWTVAKNRLTGNYSPLIETDKVYTIDPALIEYCALEEFNIERFRGSVIGGDWDLLCKRFCDLDIYVAFRDVLSGESEWEDSVFFKRIADELDGGLILWRCRTRDDLSRRCKGLESLYYNIRDNGYMSQSELADQNPDERLTSSDDEITVSIGRNGDLLFSNSAHRLCIAKLLKLESVPIVVAVRHPYWVKRVERSEEPESINNRRY